MEVNEARRLVEEVWHAAGWFGFDDSNTTAETFGLGFVANKHKLDREEVKELLGYVQHRIQREQHERFARDMVSSAVRNRN